MLFYSILHVTKFGDTLSHVVRTMSDKRSFEQLLCHPLKVLRIQQTFSSLFKHVSSLPSSSTFFMHKNAPWESNACRMEPQIQPFNCQVLVPSVFSLSIVFYFFWISLNMVQLCIHKWPEFCWWWPNIGFLYKLTSRHLSNISPNWPFENYL